MVFFSDRDPNIVFRLTKITLRKTSVSSIEEELETRALMSLIGSRYNKRMRRKVKKGGWEGVHMLRLRDKVSAPDHLIPCH